MKNARVRLRRAGPGDAAAIAEHNLILSVETETRRLDPATVRCGVEAVLSDPAKGFYVLAESGGRIAGQCMVTFEWSDWRCGYFWWIQSVFVQEAYRRTGVFSRIFEAIDREARKRPDVVGIRLYADRDNLAALEAYRSLGLRTTRYLLLERDYTDEGR
ncbi:MAG: GNAT family N-acetyltransferase [Methanomicrobiaceae archaeon]|uniref:Acetyltransferase, gnat family n=1 Tax=hydrocarbon metagenome TaxID=938273 RepID=A0A0W8FE87_9ZZZZ|nr:GNAT family N-acetyltransferase [Methanomicrobiaceae archaeon]MDD5420184.1 GNAT family N-acetyltransferase [Methanomicrobiaceae archaeon]